MDNDSIAPRKTEQRISGTLHVPKFTRSAERANASEPSEKAEESEVAVRHTNTGQKDHKGAR